MNKQEFKQHIFIALIGTNDIGVNPSDSFIKELTQTAHKLADTFFKESDVINESKCIFDNLEKTWTGETIKTV